MYLCEHWACNETAAIDSPVCVSHESQFEHEILDDCPSCDQLKESEFTFCGDCDPKSYGPVLDYSAIGYWNDEYDWVERKGW